MSAASSLEQVRNFRVARVRKRRLILLALVVIICALFVASLMMGEVNYSPQQVWQVIVGNDVPGASFTVGRLRLPRAAMAVVAGLSFGLAGSTFQTILRNPLASPDVIGISTGASAAAAIGIIFLHWEGLAVKILAVVAALAVAVAVYALSYRGAVAGTRLILIGIGMAAMLESVIAFALDQAPQWDLQETMRWLTGSLNGTTWGDVGWTAMALVVCAPILLILVHNLSALQLGDDVAGALGVRVEVTRFAAIVAAVALVAFATAGTGPIAFVAFLSGPIAARVLRGSGSVLLPAALIGAILVLGADFISQVLFVTRYPVGVITGALGAPYLVYLIVRSNQGGTL